MKNPRFDYEEPVLFLVEKKEDKKRFLRNLFVDTYEKDPRANIGFPGKYQKLCRRLTVCVSMLKLSMLTE